MLKNIQILFFLFCILISCNKNKVKSEFPPENGKTISLGILVDSCWNEQKLEQLKIISDEKFVRTMNGIEMAGNQEEIKAHMKVFFTGFPDMKLKINEIYTINDRAFTKWTFTGSNTGIFGESPATGKKVKVLGSSIILFNSEGKIVQEEVFYNELDLLQQLGFTLNYPILK
jgi:steroid delta-isomerase-like uncharacterized protein